MRKDNFKIVLETIRLILYFFTIICAIFLGYYWSAVNYQNELLKQNEILIDLYVELEDYETANLICYQTIDYIEYIALYGVLFFDIEININKLNEKCKAISYKLANPDWNFSETIIYTIGE